MGDDGPEIRLAIFYACWTGYLDAELSALFAHRRVSALLVEAELHPESPVDVDALPAASRCERANYDAGYDVLAARVEAFRPNLILVCSWSYPLYRRLCRAWAGRVPRVMTMDNQWQGTAKQWMGVTLSLFFVQRIADYAFVPGERQARFARRLGFSPDRILRPSLSGNTAIFAPVAEIPLAQRKAFIFCARVAPEKGVDVLLEAYRIYRTRTAGPWPLIVCGTGRLAHKLADEPGIEHVDFVQPPDLPAQFARAACLVLPSLFEPWAVAIHEATIAGLGVICSDACGAGDDLVDPAGGNGQVVPTGDVGALSAAMETMSDRCDAELERVRHHSVALAATINPERWAESLASVCTVAPAPA